MLIETVASLAILSILLLAVTAMLQTALRMTAASTQNARELQDIANAVILSEYGVSRRDRIIFTADGIMSAHDVLLNETGGIIAFAPEESP